MNFKYFDQAVILVILSYICTAILLHIYGFSFTTMIMRHDVPNTNFKKDDLVLLEGCDDCYNQKRDQLFVFNFKNSLDDFHIGIYSPEKPPPIYMDSLYSFTDEKLHYQRESFIHYSVIPGLKIWQFAVFLKWFFSFYILRFFAFLFNHIRVNWD